MIGGRDPTVWLPERGEVALLSQTANAHSGGEAFEVTDMLPNHLRRDAVAAVQAIPHLKIAGVDFQAAGCATTDQVVTIELNTHANFGMHYYPWFGQPPKPCPLGDRGHARYANGKRTNVILFAYCQPNPH